MFAFLNVPVAGAYHLLVPVIHFLQPMFGPAALLVAIVLFTCLIRLCLHPLARAAVRGERARQALAPKVAELQKKHKKNPARLQRELTVLYQESGTSMFAGCLPMLAQAPFFTVLYRLFTTPTISNHPNELLNGTILGVPANQHLLNAGGLLTGTTALFAAVLALLAVIATITIRWQSRQPQPAQPGMGLMKLLPYGTALFAAILPIAGAIYVLTTTTWTTTERIALRRTPTPKAAQP